MKTLVLINEKSGAVGRIGVDAIKDIAETIAAEIADLEIEIVHGEAMALIEAARQAKNYDVIAAAGGDGTQAAIAGALLNSDTALLPLPCGTMNMLCKDLGIPTDIEEALRAGIHGNPTPIDACLVNDRVFLNNVVFGAYAEMAEAREELRDAETLNDVSYGLVSAAGALFHADAIKFHIALDGDHQNIKTNTIIVSNNAITHAENLTPGREQLDAGELFVYLTKSQHGGDFAGILANFLAGDPESADAIDLRRAKRCRVGANGATFAYSVDGDPVKATESVLLEIKPRALKVMRATAQS